MARLWRRLALAASAAVAIGVICAGPGETQSPTTPTKTAKKAKAAKQPDESEQPADSEAAPKPKKVKQDPAQAQKTIEAALKLLEAGKADQAVQSLSTVLGGGNLPPAMMAKALLYRGIGYRQQKMPAQAIADLTSALWLKGGLSEADRADALRQRTSAYQEAGLTDGGEPVAPALPSASRGQTRTASAGQGWITGTTSGAAAPPSSGLAPTGADEPAPKPSSSGWSLGNPLAALFGGSAPPATPPVQAAPPPTTTASIHAPPAESPAPPERVSTWSSNTEVRGNSGPPVTSAVALKPEGKFRIQVGMVRTQDEAQALAAKIKKEHAAAVAAREPEIDQAVVGNMGSFYRVRVGPFATQQDGQAACTKLKGSGLDCLVVSQ